MSLREGKENLFLAKEKQNKRPQAVFRVDLLTHLNFMKNYFYIHTVESAFLLCKLEASVGPQPQPTLMLLRPI